MQWMLNREVNPAFHLSFIIGHHLLCRSACRKICCVGFDYHPCCLFCQHFNLMANGIYIKLVFCSPSSPPQKGQVQKISSRLRKSLKVVFLFVKGNEREKSFIIPRNVVSRKALPRDRIKQFAFFSVLPLIKKRAMKQFYDSACNLIKVFEFYGNNVF